MILTVLRLQRVCWIALLAMLSLALAPTLSHALAGTRGATAWVEICTPQGAQRVVIDESAAGQDSPRSAASHLEHCAYCSLSAHAPALPPAPSAWLTLPLSGADPPPLFLRAPSTPFAWRSAQPRAPPAPF